MTNEIPIFFSIDDNYAPFLAVALTSAIKNSSPERQYKAIVLHRDLNEENIKRLKALEQKNFLIELTPMQDMNQLLNSDSFVLNYFTLAIYFRLFIPAMFPQYDKGIYIDSDVVITSDIAELYDINIGDNLIGACSDLSIQDAPPLVAYTENAIGVKKGEYINSGVLLMNLKKLRECDLEGHFLNLLNTYHFDTVAPDQDYLNAMCNGKIYYLDKSFNTMPNASRPLLEHTNIIHYNLYSKPWCYSGVQYESFFWKYAEDSGYIEEIKARKNSHTDDKKATDKNCFNTLVQKTIEIPNQEITFKKLYEKGVKIRLC